jgi:hypothetical protein
MEDARMRNDAAKEVPRGRMDMGWSVRCIKV